ncbi:hypothetical protein A4R26_31135 [Niastella populi]|uniref:DUF4224 domain-containing protein n=1 Tax=Niastella populi TaxID=550983 RepID=A0A1V9ESE5_9BACT|nr:hypothetical protein A4R26_31135 [Niastella populi]
MFLSITEINQLTGKKKPTSQARALRFMGIEHKIRPDGKLLVSRAHVEKLLDGESVNNRIKRRTEPDWSMFNAKKTQ